VLSILGGLMEKIKVPRNTNAEERLKLANSQIRQWKQVKKTAENIIKLKNSGRPRPHTRRNK